MDPDLFEIEISINAMEASVGLTPKGMSSFGVQEADVMLALRKEGVLHGVQKDQLASAVAHFRPPDRTRRMFLVDLAIDFWLVLQFVPVDFRQIILNTKNTHQNDKAYNM